MNWKRVALYGLVYGAIGIALGVTVAIYTDGVELPPEVASARVQERAKHTFPGVDVNHRESEGIPDMNRVESEVASVNEE